MKIELWTWGNDANKIMNAAVEVYTNRLAHYIDFKIITISNSKINNTLSKDLILEAEAHLIEYKLPEKAIIVVLDEHGTEINSIDFSKKVMQWMNTSPQKIIFLIGGSYGISKRIIEKATFVFSLSKLTFPHQLVRLLFVEQLYRAFTILKNEKYHHA